MKHIFVLGARGYRARYGGWETFVTNFVDHYNDENTDLYIAELTKDPSKDKVMEKIREHVYLTYYYVKTDGKTQMLIFTIRSYLNTLKYIQKNCLNGAYIYVLGLKLGPLLAFFKGRRRKLGIHVYLNPDGLEHLRSKWNRVISWCFLLSEWSMIRNCDLVICDGLGIQKYVEKKYPNVKTTYIAYGTNTFDFSAIDEDSVLKEYQLEKDGYCLMVGRCVPENNYEMVIRAFMNSSLNKNLVIVSNLNSSTYYQELVEKTGCSMDTRIQFINGIYDQDKLAAVRRNAYLYIHGHSVGGTNPSLVEALSLTDLNVLYNVCFNADIGLDTALYFENEKELTSLLNDSEMLDQKKTELGPKARKRIADGFTWEKIMEQYKAIF